MEVQVNTSTPELFLELYTSVGWEPPCTAQVKKALENTIAAFTDCLRPTKGGKGHIK